MECVMAGQVRGGGGFGAQAYLKFKQGEREVFGRLHFDRIWSGSGWKIRHTIIEGKRVVRQVERDFGSMDRDRAAAALAALMLGRAN